MLLKKRHLIAYVLILAQITLLGSCLPSPSSNEGNSLTDVSCEQDKIEFSVPQSEGLSNFAFIEIPSSLKENYPNFRYLCIDRATSIPVAGFTEKHIEYFIHSFDNSEVNVLILDFIGSQSLNYVLENPIEGTINIMKGKINSSWIQNLQMYDTIKCKNVYQNVDIVFTTTSSNPNTLLKYNIEITENIDSLESLLENVKLRYSSKDPELQDITCSNSGSQYSIYLDDKILYQDQGLICWYESENGKIIDNADFKWDVKQFNSSIEVGLINQGYSDELKIKLAEEQKIKLVVDPEINYGTFIGDYPNDIINEMIIDDEYNIYLVGSTQSQYFPITEEQCYDPYQNGGYDVFVTKLDPSGKIVLSSTFIGGSNYDIDDYGEGIAIDNEGYVYITGSAGCNDFPTTTGAYSTVYNRKGSDLFVLKLSPELDDLIWSTFSGMAYQSYGYSIDINSNGNPIVVGKYYDSNSNYYKNCVMKFNPTGTSRDYFKSMGLSSKKGDVIINDLDEVYIAYTSYISSNTDIYYAKLNSDGSNNFLHRIGTSTSTSAYDISMCFDDEGNVIIAAAYSGDIRIYSYTTADVYNDQITIGGSGAEYPTSIISNSDGRLFFTGYTFSRDLPCTPGAIQNERYLYNDVFFGEVDADTLTLKYLSYLGGEGYDYGKAVGVGQNNSIVVAGYTKSSDFPVTPDAYSPNYFGANDGFLIIQNLNFTKPISLIGNVATDLYFAGNGTTGQSWESAHRLSDLQITGENVSNALEIQNVNRYLIIENCELFGGAEFYSAINITNSENIRIINCIINDNYGEGIAVINSNEITIDSSEISENQLCGIRLTDTNITEILNSDIFNNGIDGVLLENSNNNLIFNNEISENYLCGLNFENCCNLNNIENNRFYNNSIALLNQDSDNNLFEYNHFSSNFIAIEIENSINCNILNENFIGNNGHGIISTNCSQMTIENNEIGYNNESGIIIEECFQMTIENNEIEYNDESGIIVENCSTSELVNNWIYFNDKFGIFINESQEILITANFIENNALSGIHLINSDFNFVEENEIVYNNVNGIEIVYSDSNEIAGNLVENNTNYGIKINDTSTTNLLYFNTLKNNTVQQAIDLGGINNWDNGTIGNYWSDYRQRYPTGTLDENGFWNLDYEILGSANSIDNYPVEYYVIIINRDPVISSSNDMLYQFGDSGNNILWLIDDNTILDSVYTIYRNNNPLVDYIDIEWESEEEVNISVDGLPEGFYNYTIVVDDDLGCVISDTIWVIVNLPPDIEDIDDILFSEGSVGNKIAFKINDNSINNPKYSIYKNSEILPNHDNQPWISDEVINLDLDNLSEGIYNFSIIFDDGYGITMEYFVMVVVLTENYKPIVTSSDDLLLLDNETNIFINWSIQDNTISNAHYTVYLDGVALSGYINQNWISSEIISIPIEDISKGNHTFTIIFSDGLGEILVDSINVDVYGQDLPSTDETETKPPIFQYLTYTFGAIALVLTVTTIKFKKSSNISEKNHDFGKNDLI